MLLKRTLVVALVIGATGSAACGGRQAPPSTSEILAAQSAGVELGQLEYDAEGYVVALTELLESHADPDAAVAAIADYVGEHGEAMRTNAEAIRARILALEGAERRAYEQRLSEHFAESSLAWDDARAAFIEDHPDHEAALDQAVVAGGTP